MKQFFKKAIAFIILGFSTIGLSSCGEKEKIQYVEKSDARLKLDYVGHDFYEDGIAQVTMPYSAIDGDTAHFKQLTGSSELIKVRFFGIDTPESTGKVENWGHSASEFTKAQLSAAKENGTIVVSSAQEDYGKPNHDSTGERYVGLVWISPDVKNASYDELIMLNLYIVQEGYSYVKNLTAMPEYSDVFYAAETQAKDFKLNLFSGLDEEGYNQGAYVNTTLLDLKKEIVATFNDPTHKNAYDNARVRVQGTVAGYSNNILYLQSYFSKENGSAEEEGEYAGINIFTGMAAISSRFSQIGAYIEVCGLAQDSENFGFQITDANFPMVNFGDDGEAKVILTASQNTDEFKLVTHEFTATELKAENYDMLYCNVKITTPLKVKSAYVASNAEITLYFDEGIEFDVYQTFVYYLDGLVMSKAEDYIGRTFMVSGVYGYHTAATSGKTYWQVIPTSAKDLVLVTE